MTSSDLIKAIRRAIREPRKTTVSDPDIINTYLRGVYEFGKKIRQFNPDYFNRRRSIASETNVYPWPDDAVQIMNVWDLEGTAGDITGAANNGSGLIQITLADHGFSDEALVSVQDVLGTTEANGKWPVANATTNTFDLSGSAFSNTYVSGGKAFVEPDGMGKIPRIDVTAANNSRYAQYKRGRNIVIDDINHTDDIVVDCIIRATAITDIDVEYHYGLVNWSVLDLMRVPKHDAPGYADKVATLGLHKQLYNRMIKSIEESATMEIEPVNIDDEEEYVDQW